MSRFHTDADQSGGKLDLDVDELGLDLLTVVGHAKWETRSLAA